jgi:hypothetical protein
MENNKTTSGFTYEDEFSYVTETGDIYQKESSFQSRQKIGETNTGDPETELDRFRSNFSQLEQQIDDLSTKITLEEVQTWKEKLEAAQAIGDFDRLYHKLEELNTPENPVSSGADAEDEKTEDEEVDGTDGDPLSYYKQLMMKARDIAKNGELNHGESKLDQLSRKWSAGPEVEGEEGKEKIKDLYSKFMNAEANFQRHRKEHLSKVKKQRQANLAQKKKLLSAVEKIVGGKNWSAVKKIKKLQRKWNNAGSVPKEEASDLQKKFESLIKEFKSHKVDRVVKKRQQQEDNLMMKMTVLDKMDKLAGNIDHNTTDWKEIHEQFTDLTKQWKKIGRVPREKADAAWNRYKAAQDEYYDQKYRYHKEHRSKVDSFTAKKENIIEKAESLVDQENMVKAARNVNKLHRSWKKIGNLPQRNEDELWDRFKAATDAFNEKKANNTDKIKRQEEEHYQQKLKLIEKADELKDTKEWKKGHKEMQSLMGQWKAIGPVERKKSEKIWKQFKGAMDVFYDRRREHFKETKEQQKENYKQKLQILDKLRELGTHEDPIEAVNEAKKLQTKFKEIGYVPIKKKNETWQQYREACDVIYDRMRAAKSGNKFDQELAKADIDPEQRSQIQDLRKQHKKVNKKVKSLKDEVLQLEESRSNFNFSNEDSPLLKQMQENIDKTRAKLTSKQNKLEAISMEMDDLRSSG